MVNDSSETKIQVIVLKLLHFVLLVLNAVLYYFELIEVFVCNEMIV